MLTEALLHGMAFVARVLFFAGGTASIVAMARKKSAATSVLLALFASGALVASSIAASGGRDGTSFGALLALEALASILVLRTASLRGVEASIAAPVVLLITVGAVVAAEVEKASAQQFVLYAGLAVAFALAVSFVFARKSGLVSASFFPLFALAVILFALPFVPVLGMEQSGGRNWIGVFGATLQPSELAKVVLTVALAGYCATNLSRLTELRRRGIVPVSLLVGLCFALVAAQKDLGVALVVFAVAGAMMAVSSGRAGWKYALAFVVLFVGFAYIAYLLFPHVQARVGIWLNPNADPAGSGYQYAAAVEAVRGGGLLGTGLWFGKSYTAVPVVESDYVVCVIVEELGLAGLSLVVCCYAAIGLWVARTASRFDAGSFESNVAVGLGTLLVAEAFVNLGGVFNVIPMTGIALPFVSSGGSSMLGSVTCLGLLVAVSLKRKNEVPVRRQVAPRFVAICFAFGLACCFVAAAVLMQSGSNGIQLFGDAARGVVKGSVIASDGTVLAKNGDDGRREYPLGSFASHVIGSVDGVSGFEQAKGFEARLDGTGSGGLAEDVGNALALTRKGEDVVLTIDPAVQHAAEEVLVGRSGAVVAMEADTGKVLALASSDPVDLSSVGSGGSYLNRATQSLLAPGSTFKLVTLAAALDEGIVSERSSFDAPGALEVGNGEVANAEDMGYGTVGLAEATTLSLNTVYGPIGALLGADALSETASSFGFGGGLSFDLPLANSVMEGDLPGDWETAWAAIGQPVTDKGPYVTVLQMAAVMQAVAGDGTVLEPHVANDSDVRKIGVAMSSDTARRIRGILAENDAASSMSVHGVYGKTGTAERANGPDDAWYVGAAQGAAGTHVVVAVFIEGGGSGSAVAMPMACSVIDAALE